MLGDFLREAAVLITVFFPLELARNSNQSSVPLNIAIACLALIVLVTGMAFEKWR
jgi:hypothetical protein